jgi:hypothetical protein
MKCLKRLIVPELILNRKKPEGLTRKPEDRKEEEQVIFPSSAYNITTGSRDQTDPIYRSGV